MVLEPRTIGLISAGLVFVSVIPYIFRAARGESSPNPASWLLWAFIGIVMLITLISSGAKENIWPAVQAAINPCIIAGILIARRSEWKPFTKLDRSCLVIGGLALIGWMFVRNNPERAQYALYTSIVADGCASIPTFAGLLKEPMSDRPFAWVMFGVAYGLSIFAITEHTLANYALPVYMSIGALGITTPMVWYRLKHRRGKWI